MKMGNYKVPLTEPKPDIERFLNYIKGNTLSGKPPLIEYILDDYTIKKPVIKDLLGREWVDPEVLGEPLKGWIDLSAQNKDNITRWIDNEIAFWQSMGYDFVFETLISMDFPSKSRITRDTGPGPRNRDRVWAETKEGTISNWEDYEKYPWPQVEEDLFFIWEYISDNLPDGMGLIAAHGGGLLEILTKILSYEGLCKKIFDDYELVQKVADKIGGLMERFYMRLLEIDNIAAIFPGDDMGYNMGTLIAPEDIRRLVLPWHKKYAQIAHEKGIVYFLHSCGDLEEIMEDLIDYVKIDGKHSFHDESSPIIESKELYGGRIALLGGVDVDKLARLEHEKLRKYIRNIIDLCSVNGKFAIGSGNSVPNYIPLENYFIMIDEALKY